MFLVLVVEMAQITPPVGVNLIVIAKTILLALFPSIATWLPSTLSSRS